MYKVVITTSGTGSRLRELTKNTNKSLVKVSDKLVIDWILERYSSNIEIVVTIGYFGEKVKEYISQKYPTRNVSCVTVDPFEGPGSSLGYSLLQAREFLQCPFIFHCNDTIVQGNIPSPEHYNWNGISKGSDSKIYNSTTYSSVIVENGELKKIQMKGASIYDALHIGLVGIKDYKDFWLALEIEYKNNPLDSTLNDVLAISQMIDQGLPFKTVEFKEWYDTGNIASLSDSTHHLNSV